MHTTVQAVKFESCGLTARKHTSDDEPPPLPPRPPWFVELCSKTSLMAYTLSKPKWVIAL